MEGWWFLWFPQCLFESALARKICISDFCFALYLNCMCTLTGSIIAYLHSLNSGTWGASLKPPTQIHEVHSPSLGTCRALPNLRYVGPTTPAKVCIYEPQLRIKYVGLTTPAKGCLALRASLSIILTPTYVWLTTKRCLALRASLSIILSPTTYVGFTSDFIFYFNISLQFVTEWLNN